MMRRILLVLAVAALMTALPGTAFAQAQGSGGHFNFDLLGLNFSGGQGGSDQGSGGGGHVGGALFGVFPVTAGFGSGGSSEHGSAGGGGGCITFFGERSYGGSGSGGV
jgi:hypothetical protein